MTENRSLKLSLLVKEQIARDLCSIFINMFPFDISAKHKTETSRNRIFTQENTLLTMLLTMTNEDKSLQQSVNIYNVIHDKNKETIERENARIIEESSKEDRKGKRGRKKTTAGRIAKSKLQSVSTNTSAFSQARTRMNSTYIREVFDNSHSSDKYEYKWHDRRVFIADGTYLQMQDTKAIREEFPISQEGCYPRSLMEVLIEQGSGLVHDFVLSGVKTSELELLSTMINNIPRGSLLLADDLYNCYAIFCILAKRDVKFIVPGKRVRNYELLKRLGPGDELVYVKNTGQSQWAKGKEKFPKKLLLRRVEYSDSLDPNNKYVLYSSITDERISCGELIYMYSNRWDIEIGIREIKTIMDINIVRSKNPEMSRKEITAAMIAYNYIRRIIIDAAAESGFFPQRDIFQEYYKGDKPVLIDKLGRKYSRWSPGRYGDDKENDNKIFDNSTTR